MKEIVDLLQDDQRLRDERKKARKTKDKYIGLSADEASMRRGGTEDIHEILSVTRNLVHNSDGKFAATSGE